MDWFLFYLLSNYIKGISLYHCPSEKQKVTITNAWYYISNIVLSAFTLFSHLILHLTTYKEMETERVKVIWLVIEPELNFTSM